MVDVLIVEDTPSQAALLETFLTDDHTVVGTAASSAEAVKLAMTTDPDVVLMDLNLDDGTGFEATKEIKSAKPALPIIISSVVVGEGTKDRAFEVGADAYLNKPYPKAELLETIEEAVS